MPIHPDRLQSVLPFCTKSHSHVSIHVVCSAIIRQCLGPTSVISALLSTLHASVPLISQIFNPIYPSLFLIYWHSISVFRDLQCRESPRLDLACKFGNLSVEFILSKWVVVGMCVFGLLPFCSFFVFFSQLQREEVGLWRQRAPIFLSTGILCLSMGSTRTG